MISSGSNCRSQLSGVPFSLTAQADVTTHHEGNHTIIWSVMHTNTHLCLPPVAAFDEDGSVPAPIHLISQSKGGSPLEHHITSSHTRRENTLTSNDVHFLVHKVLLFQSGLHTNHVVLLHIQTPVGFLADFKYFVMSEWQPQLSLVAATPCEDLACRIHEQRMGGSTINRFCAGACHTPYSSDYLKQHRGRAPRTIIAQAQL